MTEVTPGAATSAQPSGPYPGLKPFSEEDSEFFFGRERDSEIIVANLRARRLTVLYGPSGVGKSSVLRAGCVASLRSGAQAARARSGRARSAPVVFDEWKDDPVAGIVDAVKRSVQELLGANEPGPPPTGDLVRDLIAWSHHLAGELLIVLDQFEELFGYQPTPGGAGSFDEQLARAVSTDALPASFLISLREDALALLDDRFKRRLPGLLENRLRVAHLDRESARDAIVKPIERYDALHGTAIEIEPALVEEVLDQVIHLRTSLEQTGAGAVNGGGDPERSMVATPYLQLVVSRLWDEEQRAGSTVLRLRTLERVGGASGIVRTHLDEALASLPESERDVVADLFRYLVTPSGTKIALRAEDLASYTEHSEVTIQPVLQKLAERRIGILRRIAPPPGVQAGPRYEIYHDALADSILDWRNRHAQKQLILEKEAAEREAAEAHEREERERRTARTLRILLVATALLLVLVAVAGVVAWEARQDARDRARLAEIDAVAYEAPTHLDNDVAQALLLGVQAYRLAPTSHVTKDALARLALATDPIVRVLRGRYLSVGTSPSGAFVALGSEDGSIRLWDLRRGRWAGPAARRHEGRVETIVFSDDGKRLASLDRVGRLVVWDVASGHLRRLKGFSDVDFTSLLQLSPDGELLGVGGFIAGPLFVGPWARDDWVPLVEGEGALAFAFTANGKSLVGLVDPGAVREWRTNGEVVRTWDLDAADDPSRAAFSADGRVLAVEADTGLEAWDVRRGKLLLGPIDVAASGYPIDVSGARIVLGNFDGTVALYDLERPRAQPDYLGGHRGSVVSTSLGPDDLLATVDNRGTAILWRTDRVLTARSAGRRFNELSPTSRRLARVRARLEQSPEYGNVEIETLAVSTDGTKLAIVESIGDTFRSRVILADAASLDRLAVLAPPDEYGVDSVSFTHDGQVVATGGEASPFRLWNVETGKQVPTPLSMREGGVVDAEFTRDGRLVVVGYQSGDVAVWDVVDRSLVWARGEHEDFAHVAISADGLVAASGGREGRVRLWDLATGRALGDRLRVQGAVEQLEFDREQDVLLALSEDERDGVRSVTTWSKELWDSAAAVERLCSIVGRSLTREEWKESLPNAPYRETCPR